LVSDLLTLSAYRAFGPDGWNQGELMTAVVDSSIAQYAVIEARRTEGGSECFVIAYSDEESLRDLIAQPSILGCGFATREEAHAKATVWTPAARGQTSQGVTVDGAERFPSGVLSVRRCLGAGFDLTQTGRIVRDFLQSALATAILFFCSRNAVSTIIRSFVGA
jgi:hypothetical protein